MSSLEDSRFSLTPEKKTSEKMEFGQHLTNTELVVGVGSILQDSLSHLMQSRNLEPRNQWKKKISTKLCSPRGGGRTHTPPTSALGFPPWGMRGREQREVR